MRQITNILAYFEEQPDSAGLDRCVEVARKTQAKLTLATVVKPAKSQILFAREGFDVDKIEQLLVQERQRQFEEAVDRASGAGIEITARVYVGSPAETIIEVVQKENHDFLLKTLPPVQGLETQAFGSIDMRLMRACPCPISMARIKIGGNSGRVVAALDFDEGDDIKAGLNQEILDSMALLAHRDYLAMEEVHIVHAWSVYGEQLFEKGAAKLPKDQFQNVLGDEKIKREQWLNGLVERYRQTLNASEASDFKPVISLLHGDPNTVVPQYVHEIDADALCLGTVSRSGLSRLLMGNTAEAILNKVHCSVVTHKPKGFVAS